MLATTFVELPISWIFAGIRALFPQSVILKVHLPKINEKENCKVKLSPIKKKLYTVISNQKVFSINYLFENIEMMKHFWILNSKTFKSKNF